MRDRGQPAVSHICPGGRWRTGEKVLLKRQDWVKDNQASRLTQIKVLLD